MKHFRQSRNSEEKSKLAARVLQSLFAMSNSALASLDSWPSIEVAGRSIAVTGEACIDLGGLAAVWPSLALEWEQLQMATAVPLQNYPGNDVVLLADFLCFLQERVSRAEGDFDPGHWLVILRNTVSGIVTSMFELAVWNLLANDVVPEDQLQIKELRGATGRRLKMGSLRKKQLLQKLANAHGGSHETMLEVLQSHKGCHSTVENVSNKLYDQAATGLLQGSLSVSISWDGATYAGHSVNIAMALDCQQMNAAYMRPVVHNQKKSCFY